MRVKIISDSTCDLSAELIKEHNIGIVPLIVMKDGQEFLDGITINPSDIFAHVASGGSLCSTAARGVAVYQEEFAKYAKDYDGVIHVNIGSDFASSYQNACIAASDFDNVRVIDSKNLSTGQGHVVMEACKLAQTCDDLDAIKAKGYDLTTPVIITNSKSYQEIGDSKRGAVKAGDQLLALS